MEDELKNIDYSDRTIIVCDDEDAYRKFLNKVLAKFLKTKVLIASNPSEMFELLKTEIPDLIILDLQMPVMDGQEALLELRKMETSRGILGLDTTKVIMVTGIDDSKNIMKAFRQGQCEAYLTKPIDRKKLINHIRELGLIV